jgi:hypothetical protein
MRGIREIASADEVCQAWELVDVEDTANRFGRTR